jgi:hypothetical protein
MRRSVWLAVLIACCAGFDAAADDARFSRDIVPLLKSRCVMCHMQGSAQAGLTLHPKGGYANLVGVKSTQSPQLLIAPGNAENSYLYRKLLGTQAAAGGSGERMPFGDAALDAAQIELIRRWIEAGAKAD